MGLAETIMEHADDGYEITFNKRGGEGEEFKRLMVRASDFPQKLGEIGTGEAEVTKMGMQLTWEELTEANIAPEEMMKNAVDRVVLAVKRKNGEVTA